MFLDTLPLVFVLAGLVLYVVLGGADFGAGIWQMVAPRGERGEAIRDTALHSMGPVWEANHVWLIFVLTVTWTAYPVFVGSMSTLALAFLVAGIGIILRGATYALRSAASLPRELRLIHLLFGVASLLTPFALGAAAGGVAALRVPVGNAAGSLLASWLNPVSVVVGALAVAFSAYLAAVYLAGDAVRRESPRWLVEALRRRAVGAGVVAGGLAVAGLVVIHFDAPSLGRHLLRGGALAALIVSLVAGVVTLGLVARRRFEIARIGGAVAVAAVIAGWAAARYPVLLHGLTVRQAAASHDTLVAIVIAVVGGGALLFPALGLLFRLALSGTLQPGGSAESPEPPLSVAAVSAGLAGRAAVAFLIAGFGLLTVADAPWAHGLGAACLFGFVLAGFAAIVPQALAEED